MIAETDLEMQQIRQKMENTENTQDDAEVILERLKKFDVPIV